MTNAPMIEVKVLPAHKGFGNQYFIPLSEHAILLCDLLKRKYLRKEQLQKCKNAGWHVVIRQEEITLD